MAINSKTKIGGHGEQADRMIRASAEGQASVDRGRSEYNAQVRSGVADTNQRSQMIAGLMDQQASRDQQQSQFDEQMAQRDRQFGQQMDMERERLDLDAAKSGFERGGQGEGPQSDRQKKLAEEMERGRQQVPIGPLDEQSQQRLNDQGQKGLEMDGSKWRPTEERQNEQKIKQYRAETERFKAEVYRDQIGLQYQQARAKRDREAMKSLSETLVKPINSDVEKFDSLMNGKAGENEWNDLKKMAETSEGMEPMLAKDIADRNFSPRVQQFMRAQISQESLKYVVRTGDTSNLKIDWSSPKMKEFTEQVAMQNAVAKAMGPEFSQFAGITSVEDKMTYLNTLSAMMVLQNPDTGEDITGGALPSTGGGGGMAGGGGVPPDNGDAQASRGTTHPYATDEMTQKAIKDRAAGDKTVPPTDSPEFQRRYGKQKTDPWNTGGFGPR